MRQIFRYAVQFFVFAATFALLEGCEGLHEMNIAKWGDTQDGHKQEEVHRKQYQADRDPAALRWLLAHRIHTSMRVEEVNNVLGEEGAREYNDNWLTTKGGQYRTDDKVYKWGPDANGRSVYLVFRDGRLTNFDPSEYE